METLPTQDQSAPVTKSASTKRTSRKKHSELSTQDGSPTTAQDQIVLAMLGELKNQKYTFRIVNVTIGGERQAAILLTNRLWVV